MSVVYWLILQMHCDVCIVYWNMIYPSVSNHYSVLLFDKEKPEQLTVTMLT